MRRIHTLAVIPLFVLAGCSAPAASPSPAASASSAATQPSAPASNVPAGNALAGDGYTLSLPQGWTDVTADFKKLQAQVDTGAKQDGDSKDGFNDNVNIVIVASPEVPMESLKQAIEAQLKGAGSTRVTFKESVQLDGKEALQVWSHTKGLADDVHTIQFVAPNGGKQYVVTVSTNRADAQADTLAQQLVGGWKWAAA